MALRHPLAEATRPDSLDDFVGQGHLRQRLRTLMQSKRLPSLLLFGPPGCGKSSLALILAKVSGLAFERHSAPEVGLTSLRRKLGNVQLLILDELHRFSKAQQDFFLPLLESGDIVLLATTTENPSFSVTRQLLSRLHVLRLRSLSQTELMELAQRALKTSGRTMPEESLRLLANLARGDARAMLNLLEFSFELPVEELAPDRLRLALPEVVLRGDRDGDTHYELASALIKSIRGSDADAALYYLACLVEHGEDPRFVCRRLILSASEDIGLGDPMALPMAVACQHAVEFVGMPEGFIPLAETVVYLALAPKSNSTYAGYLAAQAEIRRNGPKPVPLHLRNASTGLQKEWGYGRNYKYPHAYPNSWIPQLYLPEELAKTTFYSAKDQGWEPRLQAWLRNRKREHEMPNRPDRDNTDKG